MLPFLEVVRFEARDGALTLAATDRYTLAAYSVDHGAIVNAGEAWSISITVTDVKRILSTFKSTRRDDPQLFLSLDGDVLTISNGSTTLTVHDQGGPFPAWRTLLVASDAQASQSAGFNAEYLARFAKAPRDNDPIVMHAATGRKPSIVTAGDYFVGAICQVRAPHGTEWHDEPLPAWLAA
jgi:DNA polymerase III sliding clamp (beta) subunit (PCNA family)